LNGGGKSFCVGVGDAVEDVFVEAVLVVCEGFHHPGDGGEFQRHSPLVPALKEPGRRSEITIWPKVTEGFFDSPSLPDFEFALFEVKETAFLPSRQVLFICQPKVACPFKCLRFWPLQAVDFRLPDLIYSLIEQLADMKAVVYDIDPGQSFFDGFAVTRTHVNTHGHDVRPTLLWDRLDRRYTGKLITPRRPSISVITVATFCRP
jgi:hypothetical protein